MDIGQRANAAVPTPLPSVVLWHSFDFSGWAPRAVSRFVEDPARKTADIMLAASALAQRPDILAGQISNLICASAGYMAEAVARHPDSQRLPLSPHGFTITPLLNRFMVDLRAQSLIDSGRAAAAADEPIIIEAASTTNEASLMFQVPYYTEPDRGAIPAYDNQFNLASWEPWLRYDAHAISDHLHEPTIIVHSQAAAIPHGAEQFAARLAFATTQWLDDVTQFDFYDDPDAVAEAADAVVHHLLYAHAATDVAGIRTVIEAMATMVDLKIFGARALY